MNQRNLRASSFLVGILSSAVLLAAQVQIQGPAANQGQAKALPTLVIIEPYWAGIEGQAAGIEGQAAVAALKKV